MMLAVGILYLAMDQTAQNNVFWNASFQQLTWQRYGPIMGALAVVTAAGTVCSVSVRCAL